MAYNKNTGMWEGYIYCIENNINHNKYIGQTIRTIAGRWAKHLYNYRIGDNFALYNAFSKYGIENFKKYEIEKISCATKSELLTRLNDAEINYVASYNTFLGNGYNMTCGGDLNINRRLNRVIQYDFDGNTIATYECATDAGKMIGYSTSHILECCRGIYKSYKGFLWTFEGDNPIVNQKTVRRRVCKYSVRGELLGQWNSIKEASNANSVTSDGVSLCCRGKQIISGGYVWRFVGDEFNKYRVPDIDESVEQYSLDGMLISEFFSINDASEKLNISREMIKRCCTGGQHQSHGFVFCYKGETPNINIPTRDRPVNQYSLDGEFVESYKSIKDAVSRNNFVGNSISLCCRGKVKSSHKFIWKYAS